MTAITATDARKNFFGVIKQVNDDRVPIEVVSKHGNVVVMSKEDFDSMSETAYLLRNPANAQRLLQAVADVRAGRIEQHDLLDTE
jgi:antitoxin YefM